MENLPSKKAVDEIKKFGRAQPHELDFIGLVFDLSDGKRENKWTLDSHQVFLKNNKNHVKKKITKNKNYFSLGRPLNSYKNYAYIP